MTEKNWKKVERRIASYFNSQRTPLSGFNSRHTESDTLNSELFIEIKTRKKIPFLKTFKETIEKAKKENKIPLVVFVEKNSRTPIVMCNINNLKEIGEKIDESKINRKK